MLLLLIPVASAAWPEDVSILAMDNYDGESTAALSGDDYVTVGYHDLVKELGIALANKPMTPAETLGVNGFSVSVANTVAFIRTGSLDGVHPSGWDLADPNEDPPVILFVPYVQIQKGLPASLELGTRFGWVGESRTGVFGFNGRWGIVEGYRQFPDLSVQIGYSGYVGNDELELGVMDMGATLGYTLPFGVTAGIHQAQFSPFIGVGVNRIHAAPRVDLSNTGLTDRVTEVSGFKSSEVFDKEFAPLQVSGGFRIVNGDFSILLSSAYAPQILPTVNVGLGFVY